MTTGASMLLQTLLLAVIAACVITLSTAFVVVPPAIRADAKHAIANQQLFRQPLQGLEDRRTTGTATRAVREVTAEELEKEMTEWDLPMILDVFAVWCGPCLMLKPELEKAAEALEGKCRVLKLDSDEYSDMATALHVYGLPTVMYLKNGELKHKTEGSMPSEEILQLADVHLFGGVPPSDPADSLFIDTNAG